MIFSKSDTKREQKTYRMHPSKYVTFQIYAKITLKYRKSVSSIFFLLWVEKRYKSIK